jgi:hypothetical protein
MICVLPAADAIIGKDVTVNANAAVKATPFTVFFKITPPKNVFIYVKTSGV